MTGPHDSVLGRDKGAVVRSLITGMPHPYVVARDDVRMNGMIVELNPENGQAISVERINLTDPDWTRRPEKASRIDPITVAQVCNR